MQNIKSQSNMMACRNGFTLIEVLISIAILGIGVLGMASMQLSAINGNNTAGKITANATWAMDRIEQLIVLPYDHADLNGTAYDAGTEEDPPDPIEMQGLLHNPGVGADGLDNNRNGQIDEADEAGDMSIEWRVVDDYPIQQIKTIRINVAQGLGSKRKTVTIVTYKMDAI